MGLSLKETLKSSCRLLSGSARANASIEVESNAVGKLAGTVPSHRLYLLLHTPEPPLSFPSKFSTVVQRELQLRLMKWGGIVNFSWRADQHIHHMHASGAYMATGFSVGGGILEIPEISMENVNEVAERLKIHAEEPTQGNLSSAHIDLYVCTHGARDCRCGDTGGSVVKALREEVENRRKDDPQGPCAQVRIGEVGHVGGHKFAANILVFPHGEWLGLLTPDDVPRVLDVILEKQPRPAAAHDMPLCPSHWRGRMGLGKEEQLQLHASYSY